MASPAASITLSSRSGRSDERAVVKHGAEQKAAAAHRRQIAPRVGRHQRRTPVGVNVVITLGQPEEQLEARVAQRLGEHDTGRLRRSAARAQLHKVVLDPSQPLVAGTAEAPIHEHLNARAQRSERERHCKRGGGRR